MLSCKLQFSATAGTLFHDSHLPLTKWFAAISLMSDAKKGISASQLGASHRHDLQDGLVCGCTGSAKPCGKPTTFNSEIHDTTSRNRNETYIGGQLRHQGSKAAKASKTMVIGMAERNGRIHLESMSNRRFDSIKPVLDAKLAENTKEVVTDGNPSYKGLIPREKHARGNHSKELREGVWTTTQTVENAFSLFKAGHRRQLSQAQVPGTWIAICASCCWRYNRRRMQTSIFDLALTSMVSRTPLPI